MRAGRGGVVASPRCAFLRGQREPGMAGKLVGIDLGTTFSAIATLDDHGHPEIIPNRDNEPLTTSAVYLLDDGSAVVGQAALEASLEQPDRVATLVKRRMGESNFGR